jgi:hypothetical protein
MAIYALVRLADEAVVDRRDFAEPPPDLSRKGVRWLPLVVTDPPFDAATEVRTGPAASVLPDRVTETWTVRAMTADELDARKDIAVDAFDALTLRIAFNHENRIRALEGKQAATVAQFRSALKALL